MVAHVADCDECRIIVVDATEFAEGPVLTLGHSSTRTWAIAASLVLIAATAAFVWRARQDPLEKVIESYGELKSRPIQARLSGFPYREPTIVNRGDRSTDESDPAQLRMEGEAGLVRQRSGNDATTLHARGVAHLVVGNYDDAVHFLEESAQKDPSDPRKWSDLSAAFLSAGRAQESLGAANRALSIDRSFSDALFNEALACEAMDRPSDAIQAFQRYLTIDSASQWAAEARSRIEVLHNQLATYGTVPTPQK
jgi:tetratricopeptide (TPR) repeat protein